MTTRLTDKQKDTYDWICAFWLKNFYPPTIREIGDGIGTSNPNGVVCHLRALRDKGFVTWVDGNARTLVPKKIKQLLSNRTVLKKYS